MNSTIYRPTASPTHPSSLFPEISKCRTMRDLAQVHASMIKSGKIHDPLAAAEILRFCALSDHRDIGHARKVFGQIREPNCFSWNTIIRALAETRDYQPLEGVRMFDQMVREGSVEPNRFTFPSVLKSCARAARIGEGKQVHGMVVKLGLEGDEFVVSNLVRMYMMCGAVDDAGALFERNVLEFHKRRSEGIVVLWNIMVDGYVRIGDFGAARKLFDEMPQRSVVSWNGFISGCAQNGQFKEALEMFREMQIGDVRPNYVTLVSVLPAISRLGALELGNWVHLYAEKNNIKIDDVLGSALVDMYSKCGSIEKAVQVFEGLPKKNPITWNTLITGLAMHGRAKDALHHFTKMKQNGVTPTNVTYIGVLSACSHSGLVDEGRAIFNDMVSISGIEPKLEHYGCMVDLFGRAGLFTEAEQLILSMPMKPDDIIWKALVGACKTHGNVDMGKRIAQILIDSVPEDSGAYVALSNIHASSGDWEAVAEVRLTMKERDIRKDPGCSYIELDGAIHEFLVEDSSHPKAETIHEMLTEMSDSLVVAGHEPNTKQVLLNVGEGDKEGKLCHHSEKIATAFGLISTSRGTTLRIVKNLRICEDCHSSLKLVSEIYERRIVVRDRKRFHHFEHGRCSCMDYW